MLKISPADGGVTPFVLNDPQLDLMYALATRSEAKMPLWVLVLKARQIGFSTLITGLTDTLLVTTPNVRAHTILHTDAAKKDIHAIASTFLSNMPDDGSIIPSQLPQDRILFGNQSMHRFSTAGGKGIGRGGNVQVFHGSEIAHWETSEGQTEDAIAAALNAVSSKDLTNTLVFLETTANGVGDWFHRTWEAAERGENEYLPFFVPWFAETSNRMAAPPSFEWRDHEKEMAEQVEADGGVVLTNDQVYWYRWVMDNKNGGSLDKMRQENPSNPREAFLFSGLPFFDRVSLEKYRLKVEADDFEALAKGRVSIPASPTQVKWVFKHDSRGQLDIWEEPKRGEPYYVGVDVTVGEEVAAKDPDRSVVQVVNGWSLNQAAEWCGHCDPDTLAYIVYQIAHRYNEAFVGIEANAHGLTTVTYLRDMGYPLGSMYRRRQLDHKHKNPQPTQRLGWDTNGRTRGPLLDLLNASQRDGELGINSPGLVAEMFTFVTNKMGKPEATSGKHDDRVLAMAIALQMIESHPPDPQRTAAARSSHGAKLLRELERKQARRRATGRHVQAPTWQFN